MNPAWLARQAVTWTPPAHNIIAHADAAGIELPPQLRDCALCQLYQEAESFLSRSRYDLVQIPQHGHPLRRRVLEGLREELGERIRSHRALTRTRTRSDEARVAAADLAALEAAYTILNAARAT